jgi:hypothetical protein
MNKAKNMYVSYKGFDVNAAREKVESFIKENTAEILKQGVKSNFDKAKLDKNDRKLTQDEIAFFAAYLAVGNMGMSTDAKVEGSVAKVTVSGRTLTLELDEQSLRRSANYLESALMNLAEDDDMAQGLDEEVRGWRKDLSGKTLGYIAKTWPDMASMCVAVLGDVGNNVLKEDTSVKPKPTKPESDPKPKPKKPATTTEKKPVTFKRNTRVVVKFDSDEWYLGKVKSVTGGKVNVVFDDGDEHSFAEKSPKLKIVPADIKNRKKFLTDDQALGLAKKVK